MGTPIVGRHYFPTLNWWVLMTLVVPTVAVFVTGCVVWVSARVSTYQAANSISGFIVLPAILLGIGQLTGAMIAEPMVFGVIGLALAGLDVLLMFSIARTFNRERVVASFL